MCIEPVCITAACTNARVVVTVKASMVAGRRLGWPRKYSIIRDMKVALELCFQDITQMYRGAQASKCLAEDTTTGMPRAHGCSS